MANQNMWLEFSIKDSFLVVNLPIITECYIFAIINITTIMSASVSNAKVQTAFRFNPDLIERLKARAKKENEKYIKQLNVVVSGLVKISRCSNEVETRNECDMRLYTMERIK